MYPELRLSRKRYNRVATPAPTLRADDSEPLSPESSGAPAAVAPEGWVKGQLLNVRHAGPGYRVTLLGEEFDPRYPDRCLEFSNGFECQQFVSNWYARQSHDPRA